MRLQDVQLLRSPRQKGSSVNVPPQSRAGGAGSGQGWGNFRWPQMGEFGWPPGNKALFFEKCGFRRAEWEVLVEALRTIGASNPVVRVVQSLHGSRYIVDGRRPIIEGEGPKVRTIWLLEPGSRAPRLITAYPCKDPGEGRDQRT